MDVSEIRDMMLMSAELPDRMQRWVDERLAVISQGKGIYPVNSVTRLALHIVPSAALSKRSVLGPPELRKHDELLEPFGTDSPERRFNLQGRVAYRLSPETKRVETYVQLFRGGQIEAVANEDRLQITEHKKMYSLGFEQKLIEKVTQYFQLLQSLEIAPPLMISISIDGTADMGFHLPRLWADELENKVIPEENIQLPTIWLDDWISNSSVATLLRPAIDALWNASGWERSPNFNSRGDWSPQK